MQALTGGAATVEVAVGGAEDGGAGALLAAPFVCAPVAAMRVSRSAAVVQVTLVPGELTRGSAAQLVERSRQCPRNGIFHVNTHIRPPAHGCRTNLPFTH